MSYLFNNKYLLVLSHFLFLTVLAVVGTYLQVYQLDLQTIQLAPWDPSWYRHIAQDGYFYKAGEQSSVAFFPLFPLLWRWLGVNELGICLFNFALLLISLSLLVREYKLSTKETLVVSSSVGLFYCWLPFSESVFLITSIILLIGYKRNNKWLTVIGLFLASLSRSAAVVFVPATLVVSILQFVFDKKEKRQQVFSFVQFLVTCCVAVFFVAFIQWQDTGEWFVFSKAHVAWNKKFQLPVLPIKTWDNFKLLFIDASSMIVGALCGFMLICLLFKKVRKQNVVINNDLNFSLAYLCFVTVVSLLFGVQGENTTYLNSLNRYIFGTGFFLVLIIHHIRNSQFSYKGLALVLATALVGIGVTGYFSNPYDTNQLLSAKLDALGIVFCFALYYYISKGISNNLLFIAVYVFQSALQLHFFELYLKKNWVG